MWESIKAHAETVTGSLVAVLALIGALGKYTKVFSKFWAWLVKRFGRSGHIEAMLMDLKKKTDENHYQLHPNGGGSMRDDIAAISTKLGFLMEVNAINYRALPYPAFHCQADGRNLAVSSAYQVLLELTSEEALSNLNWHGYINAEDVGPYFESFQVASEGESDFRHSARFQRSHSEPLGRWMVEAHRINDGSYLGRFHPDDEEAEKICDAHDWER